MRKKQSYLKKYGAQAGAKIYELLQKQARYAGLSAQRLKKLKLLRDQLRRLGYKPCA